jgi:hypothetical protein
MELLTDILAIFGWGLFGIFAAGFSRIKDTETQLGMEFFGFVSCGLIAASLVLG